MKIKDKRLENKANDYLSFMKKRRSNYEVSDEPILSNNELIDFVKECFDNAPSSFNFKSQRVVVLLNDNHKQLWDITANKLPPPARERIKLFRTAGATLLFYIDTRIVAQLDKAFPEYIGMFEKWENESNAMLQFQIWVGLSNLGYGVNLQHYNKLIEEDVTNAFDIPTSWELVAQMPIGKSLGELPKLHPLEKIERVITRID